mmetsp:Transcript_34378/g.106210  ORF Transcript_34378/g.106210 Transcript_34378/m.106210 type:complete len:134 (-) Transcript_34378:479-880(-)
MGCSSSKPEESVAGACEMSEKVRKRKERIAANEAAAVAALEARLLTSSSTRINPLASAASATSEPNTPSVATGGEQSAATITNLVVSDVAASPFRADALEGSVRGTNRPLLNKPSTGRVVHASQTGPLQQRFF